MKSISTLFFAFIFIASCYAIPQQFAPVWATDKFSPVLLKNALGETSTGEGRNIGNFEEDSIFTLDKRNFLKKDSSDHFKSLEGTVVSHGVTQNENMERLKREINKKSFGAATGGGAAGGALIGAAAGAAAGSVIPVVGTTIGAVVGGVAGALGGGAIGAGAGATGCQNNTRTS